MIIVKWCSLINCNGCVSLDIAYIISFKRDVKKASEQVDWKKKTRERGWWKRLAYEAVKNLQAAPHP